ncbi:DUF427 domain-containing protein [Antrihabitans sp. YC2-6]|uniref:DUF427 domain-containing protein n=1 Tax=Antrihabitans sp. YC2-6 TaxID=2799498 RepID=UPI0018F75C5B|nr:DUF427 domain-containing protein [Antrihabitans sp. YC2-6]MBJ8344857.1 DUF427 domain-containing protein [Antrihabitans sp. YC2-6]
MSRQRLLPSPAHPITVTPTRKRVTATVGDLVVADTANALTLQESTYPAVQYIPLDDVDRSVLERTDTQTYCPFKGDASYYSVKTADGDLVDAVWTYEQPYDSVADIAGYVAFYPNKVAVTVG